MITLRQYIALRWVYISARNDLDYWLVTLLMSQSSACIHESQPVWIICWIWRRSCDRFETDLMLNQLQRSALLLMDWTVFRHLIECFALKPMLTAVISIIWVTKQHVVSDQSLLNRLATRSRFTCKLTGLFS